MRNVDAATYDTTAFYRNGQGSGIAEAWSSSFWLKTAFTGTASQSYGIVYYGKSGNSLKSSMGLFHETANAGTDSKLWFRYGVSDCYLQCDVDVGIASNTWFHVMMTYDGEATVDTGSGFFNFYINGVSKTPTWSFVGPGTYKTTINFSMQRDTGYDLCLMVGRKTFSNIYAPNSVMEEFATWKGVELDVADALNLYNSGTPFDLNASFTPLPYTYYRCGDDGDVAADPLMEDNGTSGIDLTMQSGTVANYVSDVPPT